MGNAADEVGPLVDLRQLLEDELPPDVAESPAPPARPTAPVPNREAAHPPPLPPPLPKRPKPPAAAAPAVAPDVSSNGTANGSGLSGLLEEEHQRRKEAEAREKALAEKLEAMKGLEEAQTKLKAELESSEAERRDLARALAEVESQVPDLQQELRRERQTSAGVQQELAAAQQELAATQEALSTSQSENGDELDRLREELRSALLEQERLKDELEQSGQAAKGASASARSLEQQLGMLRRERDGLADQLRAVEEMAEVLHTQLKDLTDEREQHTQRISELEARLAGAQQPDDLRRVRAELAVVKKKLVMVQQERDEARAQTPQPSSDGPGWEETEALRAERDELRQDVASMKRKLIAAESAMETVASLRAKVARLEGRAAKK